MKVRQPPKYNRIVIDMAHMQEVMYWCLVDNGVFIHDNAIYQNRENRYEYIKECVDAVVYTSAYWRESIGTYDSYIDSVHHAFEQRELGNVPYDRKKLYEILNLVDDIILCKMPGEIIKLTWNVWSVIKHGSALILTNDGDYRVIMFGKMVEETPGHPLQRYLENGVLYSHDS